jgi:hypothetical protein
LETFLYLNGKKSNRSLSNGQIAGVIEGMIQSESIQVKNPGPRDPVLDYPLRGGALQNIKSQAPNYK